MSSSRNSYNVSLDDLIAQEQEANMKKQARRNHIKRSVMTRKPLASNYRRFNNSRDNRYNSRDNRSYTNQPHAPRRMDGEWKHDLFSGKANTNTVISTPEPKKIEANPIKYDVSTQIFVGGLDPSLDKDTLVKLFGMVPNMVSVEMDMDGSNNFRGTAVVVYSNRSDAETAVARFDNQELSFNNITMKMRVRMLGNVINVSGSQAQSTSNQTYGFFSCAMDNPNDPRFGPEYVPQDDTVVVKGRGFRRW